MNAKVYTSNNFPFRLSYAMSEMQDSVLYLDYSEGA